MYEFLPMFLLLLAGHLVADYPFQGNEIALGKNKFIEPARFGVPWYYWMASHAATHALAVAMITGNFVAGLFEFAAHFVIDYGKCAKKYGLHVDQALHAACKLIIASYVLLK